MTPAHTAPAAAKRRAPNLADTEHGRAVYAVARRLSALAALHSHLVHGEKLHRFAQARLKALDAQLAPFQNIQWKTPPAQDPRTPGLLRHVAGLRRAREETAHAILNFQRSRTLILQRHGARQGEEGPATPNTTSPAAGQAVDVAEKPGTDPARMATADWMRWRSNQLHKRK